MSENPQATSGRSRRWAVLSLYHGGMLHVASGIVHGLAAADPAAALACFGPDPMPAALFPPKAELRHYPFPANFSIRDAGRWLRTPVTLAALRREIIRWRPDVLHVNSGFWLYPFLIPALARHMPMVVTMHDIRPHPGERRPHHGWKLSVLLSHASRVIVHSEEMRRQAQVDWRLPADKLVVMPLVSHGHCIPAAAAGVQTHPADVLLFGRAYAYKGYDVFFRALPAIRAAVPGVRVTLAGTGDLRRWRNAGVAAGAELRVFNGYISEEETSRLFAETSVVVLPYIEASQSGVALLSAACSRPVVASRVGAIPQVVRDGDTGILVEPNDPVQLAEAIVRLLRDPLRRAHMGAAAREWTEREFGPMATGRRLLDIYEGVRRQTSGKTIHA
ncbi:MAG: glycosyltransferase family 4 protein [Kiritimatiellae bacterium]|nr:glycosyltransferase family 4 protein [Kiritimatiellia bacterium]